MDATNRRTNQVYEIRLEGRLSEDWSDWFGALRISYDERTRQTSLTGFVADQGALHGLLNKIRDLGLRLVSLRRIAEGTRNEPHIS